MSLYPIEKPSCGAERCCRRSAGSRRVDPRVPRERHLRGDRPADLTGDVAGFPRLGAQLGTRMRTHISVSWPPLTVD